VFEKSVGEVLERRQFMSSHMRPQPFNKLMTWILGEYRESGSVFGIHKSLFHEPDVNAPYVSSLFGDCLGTPVGPAAGPNTQLAQNIIAGWLSGARFIELKTVQIMDELELGRPCIDMEDEGFNVEWSQELKLESSVREYIKAWALIPVLRRVLGWEDRLDGVIFNLSVGYNLEGILEPRMRRFIDTMLDASSEIDEYRDELARNFPEFSDVPIPSRLTNSCTMSTMHGCPPDEIGRIAEYLLKERNFHLSVKLNPTLMGADFVRKTLGETLGYSEIDIPDQVFEHDLKYPQAIEIIKKMKALSAERGRFFGVKLSNTLAMRNHKGFMPGGEMYMSGRPLYPITMNLWNRLNEDMKGELNVSYSAGADAMNMAGIFSCGALSVTMASDILKPGGYSRFLQCLENLESAMKERGAENLAEFAADKDANLARAASDALSDARYKKNYFVGPPKVSSKLALFDCIEAPCMERCAVCQDIPSYALQISRGDYDGALSTILSKNPLPGLTGHVCTHLCESGCTRADYDEPVGIRALKRFAAERGRVRTPEIARAGGKVAIIGAGPSGLAASAELALSGVDVTIFEAGERAGGMMAIAPEFRLPRAVLDEDVERIKTLGVEIRLNSRVDRAPGRLLRGGYDAVYVACGFPMDSPLGVEGDDADGVWGALDLLRETSAGKRPELGKKVLVIGGGNTAMDAARTAARLSGSSVAVVYRRTKKEAPAVAEEMNALLEEGNTLVELAAPVRVIVKDGKVCGLECERNRLGEPDASGRRRPEPTGEKFALEADSIISAIGQKPDTRPFENTGIVLGGNGAIETARNCRTGERGVYAGGDAATGPAIVIQACADGKRAAEAICAELGLPPRGTPTPPRPTGEELAAIRRARARKAFPNREPHLPPDMRSGFDLVEITLGEADAAAEAKRCLQCSSVCGKCVDVCPNRANYSFVTPPVSVALPKFSASGGSLRSGVMELLSITQGSQIVHIDDFCNECGNCGAFCVHDGRPYTDKPRLCLNEEDFVSQDENVFRVEGGRIRRRAGGREESLTVERSGYLYENENIRVETDRGYGVRSAAMKKTFDGELSLKSMFEMSALYEGIKNSLPWLMNF
jgi:putative selenate reductase